MYDADGNLLSDGRWSYAWDGENRLIGMTSLSSAPSGSQLQLAFAYDYQGRRIQKTVSTNNGSAYVGEYTNNYAYDGWNLIATLNSSLAILNSYLWGSDLSGSIQGAGGVGGLLAENIAGNGVQFVAYDGNGNVSALVNAANGATVANYEYGPFGEVIRATGPAAKLNPFRFSSKYDDDESELLYYGYRYYNPSTGRWLSRDPLGDWAFLNYIVKNRFRSDVRKLSRAAMLPSYLFVHNDALDYLDNLGLETQPDPDPYHYPPYDPNSPDKPSRRRVCVLVNSFKPGSIRNPGCGQCWVCQYSCRSTTGIIGGGMHISRYMIGGCPNPVGFVPGFPDKSDCEGATKNSPPQGLYPGDNDPPEGNPPEVPSSAN
jgi:RHS repeat-associated protein